MTVYPRRLGAPQSALSNSSTSQSIQHERQMQCGPLVWALGIFVSRNSMTVDILETNKAISNRSYLLILILYETNWCSRGTIVKITGTIVKITGHYRKYVEVVPATCVENIHHDMRISRVLTRELALS